MSMTQPLNRREFLATTAGMACLANGMLRADQGRRPRVAAVTTEFTYRSHAHVILENFLEPYYFNGKLTDPGMDLVSLYVDQFPENRDMARAVARQYKFPIYQTISEALTCGGKELAVDGVLSIGEHGSYPLTDRGQVMYPRKRFFDEIVEVFRRSGRVVPLFNDKHLSYRWDWSAEMMDVVHELKIPFLAGSSVPLAQRRPLLQMPADAVIEEAISIHGGPIEAYDFHGLEVLQSLVEARKGGETGVAEVQLLEGDAVWKAADEGRWSYALAEVAMRAATPGFNGNLKEFVEPADGKCYPAHAILIKYKDGLRATVLRVGHIHSRWNFACRIKGETEPRATSFHVGPWRNRNLFKALSHAIQTLIRTGVAPYPAERTHLVTGMLASAMDSRFAGHKLLATPHLNVAYAPSDFREMREMGESWKIITDEMPEPEGINTGAPRKSESR